MPNEKREYFFSEEDINKYCGEVRNYIVEVGLPFAEKFSNLDKILERINELESRQETCLDFLGHGPDHLYRVAIISKLCDDPLYVQKVEKITARLVSIQGLHPWIPGFEKLKTILETGD